MLLHHHHHRHRHHVMDQDVMDHHRDLHRRIVHQDDHQYQLHPVRREHVVNQYGMFSYQDIGTKINQQNCMFYSSF